MSFNRLMDPKKKKKRKKETSKQTNKSVVYLFNGILFSNIKIWAIKARKYMEKPWMLSVKRQAEKAASCMISTVWYSGRGKIQRYWKDQWVHQVARNSGVEIGRKWNRGKISGIKTILYDTVMMHACMCAKSLQLCPALCDPVDYRPPGYSVHEILQVRILGELPCPPHNEEYISIYMCQNL